MLPELLTSIGASRTPIVLPVTEVYCLPTLLQRCMGDKELAALLFEKFHARLSEQLDEIDRLLAAEDLVAAQSRVHSLKGEAGSLAAAGLHSAAAALQDALRHQGATDVRSLAATLRAEGEKCLSAYPAALAVLSEPSAEKNA